MRIRTIRIENFRSFRDEVITVAPYTCFVGPNGAGKSTILAALNVFFRERSGSTTDVTRLIDEDYFNKNVDVAIRITLTFDDLSPRESEGLAAYSRQSLLTVTAEAAFDRTTGIASVRHYGQRLGMQDFRAFFELEKRGARAPELDAAYGELRTLFADLPVARSKDAKLTALRDYEAGHPERCVLIPSEDDFYGINGSGMLSRFVQWVYVPAVKDVGEESQEGRNTFFSRLVGRAVAARSQIDAEVEAMLLTTRTRYRELLALHQDSLNGLATSLQRRLVTWAHPDADLEMEWLSDPEKAVSLQKPIAAIKAGEGGFQGSLSRMGHGLQRSYLLSLLQELASSEAPDAPTLILGCEEPELYQHPPQARHLASTFEELSTGNNQIIVTTHSPFFVTGEGFENVRMVRSHPNAGDKRVQGATFADIVASIREAVGETQARPVDGAIVKLHQALQPNLAEILFARVPILVEGLEDVAYITTALHTGGLWNDFRRLGCHLVPAHSKDRMIQPLAVANALSLSMFVVFDADGDTLHAERRSRHERDNAALLKLLGIVSAPFPDQHVFDTRCVVWTSNVGKVVKADIGERYQDYANRANASYSHEGGLEKHHLFIADWMSQASAEGVRSVQLDRLCDAILSYARSVQAH